MDTLTLDKPIETNDPVVALDPKLKPGKYRATVMLNGDKALSASVVLIVSRVIRPVDPPILRPGVAIAGPSTIGTAAGTPVRPVPIPQRILRRTVTPPPETAKVEGEPETPILQRVLDWLIGDPGPDPAVAEADPEIAPESQSEPPPESAAIVSGKRPRKPAAKPRKRKDGPE